jgi:hypothetical protein
MAITKSQLKTIEPEVVENVADEKLEESSSILDDIYDLAHDLFPDAVEKFHKNVGDALERAANYMEEIGPSWEAGCDRIYNKVMNFLDGAEESTMNAIDKLQHSPIGAAIDQIYKKNHRDD